MGVPADTYFREMHESDIAAVIVHGIPPPPGCLEKDAPLLRARIFARLVGNVVAVEEDDQGQLFSTTGHEPGEREGAQLPGTVLFHIDFGDLERIRDLAPPNLSQQGDSV